MGNLLSSSQDHKTVVKNRKIYSLIDIKDLLIDISLIIKDVEKRKQAIYNYYKIIDNIPEFTDFIYEKRIVDNNYIEMYVIGEDFTLSPSQSFLRDLLLIKNLTHKCNIVLHKSEEDILESIILDIKKYRSNYTVDYTINI
jgi:hypothetical protein